MNLNEIHPMQKATELRLLAAAIELQHLTGMAANMVPIPGGDRVIAVGAPAEVVRLLEVTPTAQPVAVSAGIEGLTRYRESSTGMVTAPSGKYYMAADVERLLATQSAKQGAQPSAWTSVEISLPEKYCLATYKNSAGKSRIIRAMYVRDYEIEANGDECSTDYNEADDKEYLRAGWYECIDNWGEYSSVAVCEGEVTYWMPLPALPGTAPAAPLQTMDDTTRDEALEEAAQACESEIVENSGLREQEDHNYAVSTCAKLIRAMKSSPASTDGDQKGRKS